MATRGQKVRLAAFFVVSASVLVLFLLAIAGTRLLTKRDSYLVEFIDAPVSGLNKGASVKYQGFTVGRVEDIYISPQNLNTVVVEISVERRLAENAIRMDTEARMGALGITGLKYIELTGGSPQAAVLPPGSKIRTGETFFSNLQERAEALSLKIETAIDNLNKVLGSENQRAFTRLLTNAGDLMETANEAVQDNQRPINETVHNLASMSQSLAQASASLAVTMDSVHSLFEGERLHNTVTDLHLSVRALRRQLEGPLPLLVARTDTMARNIDRTFVGIDQTVAASRQNLLRAMQDLEETLQNIRETTELIRENPAVLIRGRERSGATE